MLEVLYKNNQLIAFNKPAGIPVQVDKTGDEAFQPQAEAYCKHPLHVVNRIDRPVSGVVLFAKSKQAMTTMTNQFKNRQVVKEYLALVSQEPPEQEAELTHYLKKNEAKNTVTVLSEAAPGAEEAVMHYKVLGNTDRYFLLLIRLITGRHHQIRAQLAAIGCPVKGDVKYGARRGNRDHSIHLHAWRIGFAHPVSGEPVWLEAPLPAEDPLWKAVAEKVEGLRDVETT